MEFNSRPKCQTHAVLEDMSRLASTTCQRTNRPTNTVNHYDENRTTIATTAAASRI